MKKQLSSNSVEVSGNFKIVRGNDIDSYQLLVGDISYISENEDQSLPSKYGEWAHLISVIIGELGKPFSDQQQQLDSAQWVGARLTEYLPFELEQKQRILEMDHPIIRLEHLQDVLKDIEEYYSQGNFNY